MLLRVLQNNHQTKNTAWQTFMLKMTHVNVDWDQKKTSLFSAVFWALFTWLIDDYLVCLMVTHCHWPADHLTTGSSVDWMLGKYGKGERDVHLCTEGLWKRDGEGEREMLDGVILEKRVQLCLSELQSIMRPHDVRPICLIMLWKTDLSSWSQK